MKHKCPDLHTERCTNSSAGLASGVSLKVFKLSFAPRSLLCVYIHLGFSRTPRGDVCCCSDISQLLRAAPEPGAEAVPPTAPSCCSADHQQLQALLLHHKPLCCNANLLYIYFFNTYIYFSRFSVLRARQPVLETSL